MDNTYSTGNPGIGFYTRNPSPQPFGFSSFTATDVLGTAAEEASGKMPQQPVLCENTPNPFSSMTTLRYELPPQNFVLLKVYDMRGCEIATLVNGRKEAGRYEVRFNGASVTSGVCAARLAVGGLSWTRKMLLLK